jgi:hypothetical protein
MLGIEFLIGIEEKQQPCTIIIVPYFKVIILLCAKYSFKAWQGRLFKKLRVFRQEFPRDLSNHVSY